MSLILAVSFLVKLRGRAESPAASRINPEQPSIKSTNTVTFHVDRYIVSGSAALDREAVDYIMSEAIGPTVSLPEIQKALLRLQRAYRVRGFPDAGIKLPRQPLTDGTVNLLVTEGAPANSSTQAAINPLNLAAGPTFDIRRFRVQGNQALPLEIVDPILARATGPAVPLNRIQQALTDLQAVYRERGYPNARILLPDQLLTDGIVAIRVDEGTQPSSATPTVPAAVTLINTTEPRPPNVERTFEVRRFDVSGNSLLRQEVIDQVVTNAIGPAVSLAQIQRALGDLQLAYRERGYATVAVGLPQQQLTNAVVKVQVTEGKLVDVRVTGNHHFSSNNVMRALPSLHTNSLLNSRVFQRELDLANQNRDRQIYPTLSPGPEPGTSALTLKVQDRLPLHARMDINNYSTPGTPDWRINASAQYNNLWQQEHQVGISYGFAPQEYKSPPPSPDILLNRPLIAYAGAFYRMPFGDLESVENQISNSGSFGYDEATRQFRLPPTGGRPELSVYASASSNDTGVKYGPAHVIVDEPYLTIVSQDSGRNLTDNAAVGSRYSLPHVFSDARRFNFSAGPDLKYYSLESFNTNNFYFTRITGDPQTGFETNTVARSEGQPVYTQSVLYLPLSVGFDYSSRDTNGTFATSVGLSYNFVGNSEAFRALAYSRDAKADFGKFTLSLTRDQKLFHDWSLLLRLSGQAASGPLINNEQFALGGINSVRGYQEGDEYGDAGWFGSVELRTPFLASQVASWKSDVPVWVRGSVFTDIGQRFLYDLPADLERDRTILGVGFGLSANINNYVDVRIAVGWPLLDSINTPAGVPRTYFSLGGQF